MLGSVITASSRLRQSGSIRTSAAPAVYRVRFCPCSSKVLPFTFCEQVGQVGGDEIGNLDLDRFLGRQAHGFAHRLLGPFDVAAAQFREPSDIGGRVVRSPCGSSYRPRLGAACRLALLPVPRLSALLVLAPGSACLGLVRLDPDPPICTGVAAPEVGGRCHGRDVAGVQDVGSGARRACTARRDVHRHRNRRGEDVLDDRAHRRIQAAGRVHLQHDQLRALASPRGRARDGNSPRSPDRWRRSPSARPPAPVLPMRRDSRKQRPASRK